MRQRRNKRSSNNNILGTLKIISKLLMTLIVILLGVFIISSIKVKNATLISKKNNQDKIYISSDHNSEEKTSNQTSLENSFLEANDVSLSTNNTQNNQSEEKKQTSTTINMAFTGDIMCPTTVYEDAYNSSTDNYDFSYIFEGIKYNLQTPDITIGNLVTTFSGKEKKYSNYPKSNSPESLAYTLKKIGFDVLSTASNHCYDMGYIGLENTIKTLNDADISHTGTYTSKEEQQTVLIKNVKGISIAFLSFTYGTTAMKVPQENEYSVNLSDESTILSQLRLAKEKKPDLIVTCMNWGTEYQTSPNNEQKKLADLLFENGADVVIGNHPQVLQPMEKRDITLNDGTAKKIFIAYSLGNFLADQSKSYAKTSAILNLNISKNSENIISINSATYTPIYTYKDTNSTSKKFKIINLKNTVAAYDAGYTEGISESLYNTFNKELNNVTNLLGSEIK